MSSIDDAAGLLGRATELERVRALLVGARNGVGGALLVEGEPGIGKTALLGAALGEESGLRVVRVPGVEVEAPFTYGALQRLVGPLARFLDHVPPAQRTALRVAVGLDDGVPPQPALVGLAALSLLARSGEDRPTVCVVDDAHHVDQESLLVLGFAARRLSAESIALVMASRPSAPVTAAVAGVARMELGGLDLAAASSVLRRGLRDELDPTVAARIVSGTGGNPLALRELSAEWTVDELTARAVALSPVPIGRRLEQLYSQRLDELPGATQTWLVLAAAESTGDVATVDAAAAALGVAPEASVAAEQVEFVTLRGVVRFRHPLIRSAVYASATGVDRRTAHGALSHEARARGRHDLAAWHAAAACDGPDSTVAAELAAAAEVAGARGGIVSRAHLLARAADLSPDPGVRSEHLVAAAEAAASAGAGRLASRLLSRVDVDRLDAVGRGRRLVVVAASGVHLGDPEALRQTVATLLDAADELRLGAPQRARRALVLALDAFCATEDRALGATLERLGESMRASSSGDDVTAVVLRAVSALILEPYGSAAPRLREAVSRLEEEDDESVLELASCLVVPCVALWDWDAASRLLRRAVRTGVERGALREAETALWTLSAVELSRNAPGPAATYLAQAAQLRGALGPTGEQAVNVALLAWQGTPGEVVDSLGSTLGDVGWGGIRRMATGAVAIVQIATGEYEHAYQRLSGLVGSAFLQASFHHVVELVEAAVRSGRRVEAQAALAVLEDFAVASRSEVARGLAERGRAMLADDADAEAHFVASVRGLGASGHRGDLARTRLLYGEWLRRVRRRADARTELTLAHDAFVELGATAFARRAERELLAAGATPDRRTPTDPVLTHQEHEVARLAASGATNAEIGAALFITANTVDYHLKKVFRRFGITSRRQLRDHVGP